jgi:tripartite-type tricarboxylate transporter receptor subunit TctC
MLNSKKMAVLLCALMLVPVLASCKSSSNTATPTTSDKVTAPAITEGVGLDYPKKPITLIVPYAAGGGSDISARILQAYAEAELGISMTIVNVPGGGGEIGFTQIAKAAPDGYTIGYLNAPSCVTAYLDREVQYDFDSYEYIITQTLTPRLIAVTKDSPFNSIQEFVDYAKQNPGDLTVANTGVGGFAHITTLALEQTCGIQLTSVPFDGGSQALTALMGKQVDAAPLAFAESKNAADNGDIRILGLYTEEPSDLFPGVPTFVSAGYNIVMVGAQPLVAPAGTPHEIVGYLYEKFAKVFENPEYIAKMQDAGNTITSKDGAETEKIIRDMLISYKPLMDIVKKMVTGK